MIEIAAVCDRATVLREGETVGVVDVTQGSEERIVELMLGQYVDTAPVTTGDRGCTGRSAAPITCPRLAGPRPVVGTKLDDVSFELLPGRGAGRRRP